MAFKQLLPLHNLNFQMNRVLTHGAEACREEELLEIAPKRPQLVGRLLFLLGAVFMFVNAVLCR